MSNPSVKRLAGPVAMSATMTTNIFNASDSAIYSVVRHIHIVNKAVATVSFSLWLGATGGNAAGTELFTGHSVAPGSEFDHYCNLKMTSADFLVGGASAATSLTVVVTGEQYVV